jgi:pyridoxine 5-phosphate synthase
VELHTGAYAESFQEGRGIEEQIARLATSAERARAAGLRVNAGHGLTVVNLPRMLAAVPHLEELNIGHSLVSRAVTTGLGESVRAFLAVMRGYRPAAP